MSELYVEVVRSRCPSIMVLRSREWADEGSAVFEGLGFKGAFS